MLEELILEEFLRAEVAIEKLQPSPNRDKCELEIRKACVLKILEIIER